MTNEGIARAFAEGETKGRACSMFIDGDTIYSYGYHWPIAKRLSGGVYLMNVNKYSQTTSKQTSKVRYAIQATGGMIQDGKQPEDRRYDLVPLTV